MTTTAVATADQPDPNEPPPPVAYLVKVQVQPVFTVIADGQAHEITAPAAIVTAADWREFGANSFDTIDLEAVAAEWAREHPRSDP